MSDITFKHKYESLKSVTHRGRIQLTSRRLINTYEVVGQCGYCHRAVRGETKCFHNGDMNKPRNRDARQNVLTSSFKTAIMKHLNGGSCPEVNKARKN